MVRLRSSASSRVGQRRHVAPADPQLPGGRPVEAAEQVHQRRLAGAGRADDGDVLALVDAQAHPAQRLDRDPVELVAAPDVDGLDGRRRRRVTAPAVRRAPGRRRGRRAAPPASSPSSTSHPALALRTEPDQPFARDAVHHDPHRVAAAVAEHRRRRDGDDVARRAHPQVDDGAHARPRCRRGTAARRGPAAQREPHDVADAAAGGRGRRRVDGRHRRRRTTRRAPRRARPRPGRRARRAARRSRRPAAVRDSVDVSVTVTRAAGRAVTGRPRRHGATTEVAAAGAAEQRRRPGPAGSPAAARRRSSAPPPAASPAAGTARPCRRSARAPSATRRCGARRRRRPGSAPAAPRTAPHGVGEAAEPGRELRGRLVGAGAGGLVLRLRHPQRRERLGAGRRGRGCARAVRRARSKAAPRVGVGLSRHQPASGRPSPAVAAAACRSARSAWRSGPPGRGRLDPQQHLARGAPAGRRGPAAARRCRRTRRSASRRRGR